MDNTLKQIKSLLREIAETDKQVVTTAEVVSVSGDTCKVKLPGGLEVDDVKLKSSIGGGDYLLLIPKNGTQVTLISYTGKPDNMAVIQVDEAEKIVYKQSGFDIEIDSTDGKVKIANSAVSLKDIMDDLTGLLKQFKVATPAGPSGAPLPDTITAITQVETKFGQLLKS